MKKTILLLLFGVLVSRMEAQVVFQKTFGGPGDDKGCSALQTFDGGYIVAGNWGDASSIYNNQLYVVRTDALGDTLWTKIYTENFFPNSYTIRQTADSGFAIACSIVSTNGYRACLIKTDAGGNISWMYSWGSNGGQWALSVEQTSDGGYVLAGASYSSSYSDMYLIRVNADGSTRWRKMIGDVDEDWGYCVKQTTDGGFIVSGFSASALQGSDDGGCLMKTDSSGTPLWVKNFGGLFYMEEAAAISEVSTGGYIVAGSSNGLNLARVDTAGNPLWQKNYEAGGYWGSEGKAVRETPDGGFIAVGRSFNFSQDTIALFLLKTDASGNLAWARHYNGSGREEGLDVLPTADGGYLVTGLTSSSGAGEDDVYLIKTDSLGHAGCNELTPAVLVTNANATMVPLGFSAVTYGTVNIADALETHGGIVGTPCNPTGVEEETAGSWNAPYPNPATGTITIPLPEGIVSGEIIVYDIAGQEVKRVPLAGAPQTVAFSVEELAAGMYTYALQTREGRVSGKTFVVVK